MSETDIPQNPRFDTHFSSLFRDALDTFLNQSMVDMKRKEESAPKIENVWAINLDWKNLTVSPELVKQALAFFDKTQRHVQDTDPHSRFSMTGSVFQRYNMRLIGGSPYFPDRPLTDYRHTFSGAFELRRKAFLDRFKDRPFELLLLARDLRVHLRLENSDASFFIPTQGRPAFGVYKPSFPSNFLINEDALPEAKFDHTLLEGVQNMLSQEEMRRIVAHAAYYVAEATYWYTTYLQAQQALREVVPGLDPYMVTADETMVISVYNKPESKDFYPHMFITDGEGTFLRLQRDPSHCDTDKKHPERVFLTAHEDLHAVGRILFMLERLTLEVGGDVKRLSLSDVLQETLTLSLESALLETLAHHFPAESLESLKIFLSRVRRDEIYKSMNVRFDFKQLQAANPTSNATNNMVASYNRGFKYPEAAELGFSLLRQGWEVKDTLTLVKRAASLIKTYCREHEQKTGEKISWNTIYFDLDPNSHYQKVMGQLKNLKPASE